MSISQDRLWWRHFFFISYSSQINIKEKKLDPLDHMRRVFYSRRERVEVNWKFGDKGIPRVDHVT